jgi:hypothetical protein
MVATIVIAGAAAAVVAMGAVGSMQLIFHTLTKVLYDWKRQKASSILCAAEN